MIIKMLKDECWWGGTVGNATIQPFNETTKYHFDFRKDAPNQTMPLFLSSCGRVIWSETPFYISFDLGNIEIEGEASIETAGNTLKEAYLYASNKHFKFENKYIPEEFFKTAQYNTWMQFTYEPTEEKVLKYAHDIVDNGFIPGVLIIDEGWHGRYGLWEFDKYKFPHPKEMIDELHGLGFKVMLWVVPYVTPDGRDFDLSLWPEVNKYYKTQYLRNEEGKVALCEWWNGISAVLDMTKESDRVFLKQKLDKLQNEYGVDGFKFDGGAIDGFTERWLVNGKFPKEHSPHKLNEAWNEFGEMYAYSELKDSYKQGGKAIVSRLQDRHHSWDKDGINTLIPSGIVQGLIGYPYVCPDMIGGGAWADKDLGLVKFDEELFVRMGQCSALFPMMQFSWAPWEALSKDGLEILKEAANIHKSVADYIVELVNNAKLTGEPIVRSLEYNYPHKGYEKIMNQFMLGDKILVAPIIEKGITKQKIQLPMGKWQSKVDNKVYEGDKIVEFEVDINTLNWFVKID